MFHVLFFYCKIIVCSIFSICPFLFENSFAVVLFRKLNLFSVTVINDTNHCYDFSSWIGRTHVLTVISVFCLCQNIVQSKQMIAKCLKFHLNFTGITLQRRWTEPKTIATAWIRRTIDENQRGIGRKSTWIAGKRAATKDATSHTKHTNAQETTRKIQQIQTESKYNFMQWFWCMEFCKPFPNWAETILI